MAATDSLTPAAADDKGDDPAAEAVRLLQDLPTEDVIILLRVLVAAAGPGAGRRLRAVIGLIEQKGEPYERQ